MGDRSARVSHPSSSPIGIAHGVIAHRVITRVVIMHIARALCRALACFVFPLSAAHGWNATVFADVRHCATRSGMFEVDFILTRELGPDVQMTERFRWQAGRFEVSVEFWPDETVLDHRIGFIAPCVCREMPFK